MSKKFTKITLKESFLKRYPKYNIVLKRWEEATNTQCTFDNITAYNLKLFCDYLISMMSRNGAKTYLSMFSSVLSLHADTTHLPYNWKHILSIKSESSQHTYLSKKEIKKIYNYIPKSTTERIIQIQFILGCLTGARKSDYIKFTKSNIQRHSIIYCSQKTGTSVTVPATKTAVSIINELDSYTEAEKDISDVHFNDTLRNICKSVGIDNTMTLHHHGVTYTQPKYFFISSHTARRSFVTNLYIDDVNLYDISKMCGHSNISITQRYICVGIIIKNKIKKSFSEYDDILK